MLAVTACTDRQKDMLAVTACTDRQPSKLAVTAYTVLKLFPFTQK